jgi:hypothetical protein
MFLVIVGKRREMNAAPGLELNWPAERKSRDSRINFAQAMPVAASGTL